MNINSPEPTGKLPWPRAILFDLDGTLIDSAPDIANSVNALLAQYDLEALTLDQVRSMIGNGIRKLVERAFAAHAIGLDQSELDVRFDQMLAIYAANLTVATTVLHGAAETLAHYHQAGAKLAVVTNKIESFSLSILDHFAMSGMITAVVGGDSVSRRKPAPDMLLHALALMEIEPSDALMVGDSPADIDAAIAAGIPSIAVRGGYTNVAVEALGADFVIERLDDLAGGIATLIAASKAKSLSDQQGSKAG